MRETWLAAEGTEVTIRPICADDFWLQKEFVEGLSPQTRYWRLMSPRRLSLEEIRRLTDIDVEHEFALIAVITAQGRPRQIGVANYVKDRSPGRAEIAIVLSDDWQRRGLGTKLLLCLFRAARDRDVRWLVGTTLSTNVGTLALARKLGFALAPDPGSATLTNLLLDLEA